MTKAASLWQVLSAARTQRGLSIDDCDAQCGLGASYHHIESAGSEFFNNISLGQARRLCRLLGLDLLDLTSTWLPVAIRARERSSDAAFFSRHLLISTAQIKSGLSDEALGDACGYFPEAVSGVKRSSDAIEAMTIRFVVDLARALELDPGMLIGSR